MSLHLKKFERGSVLFLQRWLHTLRIPVYRGRLVQSSFVQPLILTLQVLRNLSSTSIKTPCLPIVPQIELHSRQEQRIDYMPQNTLPGAPISHSILRFSTHSQRHVTHLLRTHYFATTTHHRSWKAGFGAPRNANRTLNHHRRRQPNRASTQPH